MSEKLTTWHVWALRGTSTQTMRLCLNGPSNILVLFDELRKDGYYPLSAMRVSP